MAPPNKMLPGLEAVRERAIEFAKENGERFFDLASALARANNIQEVLTLQEATYAQTQMQSYAVQAKEPRRDAGKGITRLWPNDRHPLNCRTLPP